MRSDSHYCCVLLALCFALLLAGCAAGPEVVVADDPPGQLPRLYRAPFLETSVSIDGEILASEWARAPWSEEFVDIEGDSRPKPNHRTRMKMAWDEQYFYIAAELVEPHLWAEMTEHDSVIWHEDDFEVFIDPDGDRQEYYEVEINARGTVFDLLLEKTYIDGGPALHDWTLTGLKHGIELDGTLNDNRDVDQGWTVELALPWSALSERANRPSPPKAGDQWRVNFSRVDWKLQEVDGGYTKVEGERENNWVWSPQGEINMHLPERWGVVQFER